MFRRLALWAIRAYFGGTRKSWVMTSIILGVFRLIKSVTGRRELLDLQSVKPGQTILIEHLPISHKQQMKEMKQSRRQAKRQAKLAAKQ